MMKRLLIAAAVVAATAGLVTPAGANDVGISVTIGQPGFYGPLDISGYPPPRMIYREPRIIERGVVMRPPVYLRVPPGHAKHWGKHCHKYNACGERVYFVQDSWYTSEYMPRYQEQHRHNYRGPRGDSHRENHDDSGNKGNKGNHGHDY